MKYIVKASYRKPTEPMSRQDAVHLVKQLRSQDINCHIEEVRDRSNEAWQYDAPFNSQFLGAQPARAGQDY
jgi:hypothetical protein